MYFRQSLMSLIKQCVKNTYTEEPLIAVVENRSRMVVWSEKEC